MGIRRVLQIDGGSIRGIIPLVVLTAIENITDQPCYKIFDLMSGTSTGSMICGLLAAGVPASKLLTMYTNETRDLFKTNPFYKRWFGLTAPKFDRKPIQNKMAEILKVYASGMKMKDLKTNYISATFNRVTGRTHYQMSWDSLHSKFDLIDVISWSALSATYYFDAIIVPDYSYEIDYQVDTPVRVNGAVFNDGGQGRNNCTLLDAMITSLKLGYMFEGNKTEILSIGCGSERLNMPFNDAKGMSNVSELKNYLNESTNEAVYDQLNKSKALAKSLAGYSINRLDVVLSKKENSFDNFDMVDRYYELGKSLVPKIPEAFIRNLGI